MGVGASMNLHVDEDGGRQWSAQSLMIRSRRLDIQVCPTIEGVTDGGRAQKELLRRSQVLYAEVTVCPVQAGGELDLLRREGEFARTKWSVIVRRV